MSELGKLNGDGIKSRKLWLTIGALAAPFVTASFAWLALGKMNAGEWVSLLQWQTPIVLGLYGSANVAEKFAIKK